MRCCLFGNLAACTDVFFCPCLWLHLWQFSWKLVFHAGFLFYYSKISLQILWLNHIILTVKLTVLTCKLILIYWVTPFMLETYCLILFFTCLCSLFFSSRYILLINLPKTQFLIQECVSLISKPNFISTLCYAIDNPLHYQKVRSRY